MNKEFYDLMEAHLDTVYKHGTLSLELKELILIVVNTTNHTLKSLRKHVCQGLEAGLTPEAIQEAVYQCTPYVGLGKVEDALEIVDDVFDQRQEYVEENRSTVTLETRFEKGIAVQVETFGDIIYQNHKNAPEELKHIQMYLSEHCFGDFYTRDGLDGKTRELLTFVMIATLGGCESQLRSHTYGNLAMGNDRNVLIETITTCQPYIGFPRTLNAIAIINEVTQK